MKKTLRAVWLWLCPVPSMERATAQMNRTVLYIEKHQKNELKVLSQIRKAEDEAYEALVKSNDAATAAAKEEMRKAQASARNMKLLMSGGDVVVVPAEATEAAAK